jgi:hypothetical protein
MEYFERIGQLLDYWCRFLIRAWEHADWVDRGFVIYFAVIGFLWLIAEDEKPTQQAPQPKKVLPFLKQQQLLVTKVGYVRAVIGWCSQNLGLPERGVRIPDVSVSYYPHKKKHGNYFFSGKQIRVYVNNHASISQLTDTIIHEYVHFLEIRSQAHQKEYNKHLQQIGYYKNPYEISAREKAARHVTACLGDMQRMGYIS